MTLLATLTASMLDVSSSTASVLSGQEAPAGLLSSSRFGLDFLLHAGFIWLMLIGFCVMFFAYRRRDKSRERSLSEAFEDEIDAMRKGRRK